MKGGDNDHVVIGTIDFKKYKTFQQQYHDNFRKKLLSIKREHKRKKPNYPKKDISKPNIKPLSARFKIKE